MKEDPTERALNQVLDNLEAEAGQAEAAEPQPEPEPEAPQEPGVDEPEPEPQAEVDQPDVEDVEQQPDDDEQDDSRNVITVDDEDAVVVLPDGTEVPVKDGALRHADYTRKTQELAERRREFEQERESFEAERQEIEQLHNQMATWLEEKTSDPAGWATEIAAESKNPTQTIALAIRQLADQGVLDPEFTEAFGIEASDSPVRKAAESGAQTDRIAKVEAELEQLRQQEQEQAERQQRVQSLIDEWDQNKLTHGLSFQDQKSEFDAKKQTLTYALERGIPVEDAYFALRGQGKFDTSEKTPQSSPKAPARVPDDKKRATRAMQVRSSSSSRKPDHKAKNLDEAAERALDAFLAGAS